MDLRRSGPFLAAGGMATTFFLYAYTAIAVPGWLTSLVMPLAWLALVGLTASWARTKPRASVVWPVVATAIWFAVMLTR